MKKIPAVLVAALFIISALSSSAFSSAAVFRGYNSVDDIMEAIRTPPSAEEIARARALDNRFIGTGDLEGVRGYLITDPAVTALPYRIARRLIGAMGRNGARWVVRVVETKPPMINVFATCTRYVYVFRTLLEQEVTEDELALLLAHEIGHSYLNHVADQENMVEDSRIPYVQGMDYSWTSEMEADTFATVLAKKAGYDPVKGANFFSRKWEQIDEYLRIEGRELDRLAMIAAVDGYLGGKNDMAYLKVNYEQAFRIIFALQKLDSPLVSGIGDRP